MQVLDNIDYGLLQGLMQDQPPHTKQAALIGLLRGQQRPQQFSQQPMLPLPGQQQPQQQQPAPPPAPAFTGGASGSWEAPEQPQQPQPPQQRGSVLKQALAAQAQRPPQAQQPQIPQPPQAPQMDDFATRDAYLQRQHDDAMQAAQRAMQPPDMAAAQAAYKARAGEAPAHLLHAFAAQQAGRGFEGVQSHYLKQASEAEAPMKTAAGTMTPTGFIEDPTFAHAHKIRSAEARVTAIERAQASNISAAERRRLEVDKQQAQAELRQAQMGLQAQIANQSSADRRYLGDLMHADRQAALAAKGEGGGKVLPANKVADLTAGQQKASDVTRLSKEFKPEYGGMEGWSKNAAGQLPFVTTGAAEWWKNYRKEDELITRHGLFGASLTEGEQRAWRSADINPSMDPGAIARNLERRRQIMDQKYRGLVKNFGTSGYNVQAFQVPDDPAVMPANTGGAAPGLPAGWSVKTR